MGKQRASAHSVRQGQDASRLEGNRQGQAHPRKAPRAVEAFKAFNARGTQNGLAQNNGGQVGKTALYEWRCEGLGVKSWTRRTVHEDLIRAAKAIAEAIDHDEARVMAFGGKKYILELRQYGQTLIHRYEIGGWLEYKYFAKRIE